MKNYSLMENLRPIPWIRIAFLWLGMQSAQALQNGIGLTPAMGWNPWNAFLGTTPTELYAQTIDIMVANGMRDAGYTYVMSDGGNFMSGGNANLKPFIEYGHKNGFKVGLYVGYTNGNEAALVANWASMGFDYLKHDSYRLPWTTPAYVIMRDALKNCGRKVYHTIHPIDLAPNPDTICHAERVGNDITWRIDEMNWGPTANNGYGVMGEVMLSRERESLAHPGFFNDMDMMGVGLTKSLTYEEAKTHFNFWCIMASLLIEGSDLRKISKERLDILLNRELIAINQDSLGDQGKLVWSRYAPRDSDEIISKKMKDGSRAVMLFNRNGSTKKITVKISDIGLSGKVYVRDMMLHKDLPIAQDSITISGIPNHGSAMLRISRNPIITSITGASKYKFTQIITSDLFNTRTTSFIRLSPKVIGVRIFDLKGTLLWEAPRTSLTNAHSTLPIPQFLKNVGTIVVQFLNQNRGV